MNSLPSSIRRKISQISNSKSESKKSGQYTMIWFILSKNEMSIIDTALHFAIILTEASMFLMIIFDCKKRKNSKDMLLPVKK